MGRRQREEKLGLCALVAFVSLAVVFCLMVYRCFSLVFYPSSPVSLTSTRISTTQYEQREDCCRGIEHLELWGDAVNRGWEFKVNSSENCCKACKEMCNGDDGPCLCHSWVYCGDGYACGPRFGECWLKIQKNVLEPERRDSGDHVMWTSGLMFPKREGIVELKTEYGVLHIKLLPDCAPKSVSYILELFSLRGLCTDCKFYRAESRGNSWDSEGNHINHMPFGPPFGLIQGTLMTDNVMFNDISPEGCCHRIRRGSVAWVGSGPEFFISLAKHDEWRKVYTVFGHVVPEDMEVVEKIAGLPTIPEVWRNVSVSVLERPVPFGIRKMKRR